jgi:hypothetical protein
VVEQEGYRVREHLAKQPTCQMPEVFCPHPFYRVTSAQLRKDCVYPVAKTAQQGTPSGSWISFLGGVRGQKFNAHALSQLLCGFGRVVVAVSYDDPRGKLGEFWKHRELMGVGRGHREASDHPRPADPYVHPKAIEGLPEQRILAEGGLATETLAAISAGEQARRQGHRIADGEGGVVGSVGQELLPEVLFDLPEVGCLPGEGGAMHPQEVREVVSVVTPEVGKELRLFIESQKLADDLDGDDFRVAERWGGSACSEAPEVSDVVVDEAEDGDDEGVKIHESGDLLLAWAEVWAPPSVGRSRSLFNRPEKLAHGVN